MRRVRTAEGSRYYGLPIGSPITADARIAARARNGGRPAPRGSTTPGRRPSVKPAPAHGFPAGNLTPKQAAAPVAKKLSPQAAAMAKRQRLRKTSEIKVTTPSLKGDQSIKVGGTEFNIPEGSKAFQGVSSPDVAYVIDPNGKAHVFTPDGEADLTDAERARVGKLLSENKNLKDITPSTPATPAKPADKPSATPAKPADKPVGEAPLKLSRNPTSLGESIHIEESPGDLAAMLESPYSSPHVDKHGNWTPERQALHDKIISKFLEGVQPVDNPTQYMNGGGPGSGKGSMSKGENAKLTHYPPTHEVDEFTGEILPSSVAPEAVTVDPDALKMQLPEVKAAREAQDRGEAGDHHKWAAFSHEESSYLGRRLHKAALDRGLNVILDGTGNSSVESVKKKVAAAREAGHRVEANYIALDVKVGLERAQKRAARMGRVVPEARIKATYANLPPIVNALAEEKVFDALRIFDNNVPFGQPSILIASGDREGFTIKNPKAYTSYINGVSPDIAPKKQDKAA